MLNCAMKFRECWVDKENLEKGWDLWRFCVSDEHYVPTLLAVLGLDLQTDCKVHATGSSVQLSTVAMYPCPKPCTDSITGTSFKSTCGVCTHGMLKMGRPSDKLALPVCVPSLQ